MTPPPAIRFRDVTLGYGRRPAVHHLDGELAAGSLTAVVGPNGAGKSTLLKGVAGALRPLAGRIELARGPGARIAYLPQQAEIDRSFPISVLDTVLLGRWSRFGAFGKEFVHMDANSRIDSFNSDNGLYSDENVNGSGTMPA